MGQSTVLAGNLRKIVTPTWGRAKNAKLSQTRRKDSTGLTANTPKLANVS